MLALILQKFRTSQKLNFIKLLTNLTPKFTKNFFKQKIDFEYRLNFFKQQFVKQYKALKGKPFFTPPPLQFFFYAQDQI